MGQVKAIEIIIKVAEFLDDIRYWKYYMVKALNFYSA